MNAWLWQKRVPFKNPPLPYIQQLALNALLPPLCSAIQNYFIRQMLTRCHPEIFAPGTNQQAFPPWWTNAHICYRMIQIEFFKNKIMSKIYLFVSSSKQFITLFLTLGEGKKYWIRDFVNVILFVAKSTIIFNLTSLSIHKMQIFHAKKITLFSLPQLVGPIGPNFSIDAKSARVNLG